jgi:hypothetical protein
MDLQMLRKRCVARLRQLDLPIPFDVQSFCERLATRRGRPILLYPARSESGPFGLWVAGPSRDVVFYEEGTSPLHQDHIILHELCHLVCGHQPVPLSEAELARLLCPHLDPAAVQQVLRRASYSTDEECEAELLASLILRQTAGGPPRPEARPLDSETVGVLRRLEASLERDGST